MNTSLIIGYFCCLIIPGVVLVGLHHLIAFILEIACMSGKVKSDGIIRTLRDMSVMYYADEWWQHLWYWTFFTIRCAVCLFGFICALCLAGVTLDARSFIENNQEMITKYEALKYPTAQDYVEAYEYNKKYESARILATEEVGKNLKKIDDAKLLGIILENAKNAEKD